MSDGTKVTAPKFLRRAARKLNRLQQNLSRKQRRSQNRKKAVKKVARAPARVADTRRDWQHKLSTTIIRENQAVYVGVQGRPVRAHLRPGGPVLPVHPQVLGDPYHAAAAAQFTDGYGGVVSFAIAGSHQDRLRFVNDLRLITSAVSLGHDETLIAYERYPEPRAATFAAPFRERGLIRLAVGLESAHDLIADLDSALTTSYGANPRPRADTPG